MAGDALGLDGLLYAASLCPAVGARCTLQTAWLCVPKCSKGHPEIALTTRHWSRARGSRGPFREVFLNPLKGAPYKLVVLLTSCPRPETL